MIWSAQQDAALKSISSWLKSGSRSQQVFRLFGYAGTGKTTLAIEIAKMTRGPVFAAFTGKAALVMQRKGCHGASTIHKMIYNVRDGVDGEPHFEINRKDSPLSDASVCIIDECSMVDEELAADLLSFHKPVLVIGDPAQLPPVKGAGYFTNGDPDVMLTEIHRQARDNPIIRLATDVREGRALTRGQYPGVEPNHSASVIHRDDLTRKLVIAHDQPLVGLNRTRHEWNRKIRALHDRGGDADQSVGRQIGLNEPIWRPIMGDRLVCLRNNAEKGLLNGQQWTVSEILPNKERDRCAIRMVVKPDDADLFKELEVVAPLERFMSERKLVPGRERAMDIFDFGYALTVHKSQGSQWNSVLVMDEGFAFKEFRNRWLYTGLTRAAERLTVVQH